MLRNIIFKYLILKITLYISYFGDTAVKMVAERVTLGKWEKKNFTLSFSFIKGQT